MIPGPFVDRETFVSLHEVHYGDEADRMYRAATHLIAEYPELLSIRDGDREFHLWRRRPTSSLRAFWIWLLAAFVAGVVFTLLAQFALGALLSTASWSRSSVVDGSAARAAVLRGVTVTHEVGGLETAGPSPAASPARATLASASDEPPASARSVSPRATVAPLRDDPAVSLAVLIDRAGSSTAERRPFNPRVVGSTPTPLAVRASPVPRALVAAIAERHGLDGDRFADVMFCESSLRPDAIGDGGRAVGIAQWHAATWAAATRRYYGAELAPETRLDPELALEVAAAKWAAEGPWAWTCAR